MSQPPRPARTLPPGTIDAAGLAAMIQSDVRRAEQIIANGLARNPGDAVLIEARILTRLRRFDMPAVVQLTEAALARAPTANLHFWQGCALLELGENARAAAALERAVALNPSPASLDTLGRALHRVGRLEAAAIALQRAAAQPETAVPTMFASARGLIYVLRDLARWGEAEAQTRELLARYRTRPKRVASAVMHFDQVSPFHGWVPFLDKGGLAKALAAWQAAHPGAPAFAPESFLVTPDPRGEGWAALRQFLAARRPGQVLAVKPVDLFGGQGITLTREPPTPQQIAPYGACVVQRYIEDPLLLDGRKFHARVYLLVTAPAPLRAYIYRQGIVRIAPERYATDPAALQRPGAHITNTALHAGHPELVVSEDAHAEAEGNVWSLTALLDRLEADGHNRAQLWDALAGVTARFLRVVRDAGVFAAQAATHPRYCFPPALFALDLLLDQKGQAWLLECQRNPSITGAPLVNRINAAMLEAAFRMSVFPLLDDAQDRSDALDIAALRDALEAAKECVLAPDFMPLSI